MGLNITSTMSLAVIQGNEIVNIKKKASDDEIKLFMNEMAWMLCPSRLLGSEAVKYSLSISENEGQPQGKVSSQMPNNLSLWNVNNWTDTQRKNILHSLGLRDKNSPVSMTALKSPYKNHKNQIRRKRIKNSLNHAHLDFFLGQELSSCL